jgi:hypothetical protein
MEITQHMLKNGYFPRISLQPKDQKNSVLVHDVPCVQDYSESTPMPTQRPSLIRIPAQSTDIPLKQIIQCLVEHFQPAQT